MTKTLILKKTRQHYGDPHWPENDFVVLEGDQVIGRIMRHPQAPKEQPWFWTILRESNRRQFTIAAMRLRACRR